MFLNKSVPDNVKDSINTVLNNYRSDVFPSGVLSLCQLNNFSQKKSIITIDVTIPFPCAGELDIVRDVILETLGLNIIFNALLDVEPVRQHDLAGVSNIIAVSSGKGGVGKSTTAVNLAYALMAEGARVGILDADIYGPSIPTLLGVQGEKPTSTDGKLLNPIEANGLYCMSIGLLMESDDATIWRGPMASRAFGQMLNETDWPDLDYLIVDMPPGTGDIQLTLAQKVPVAGAIVVTTPQDIALIDAVKGITMFDKVAIPVIGIVENMSYHLCESCGHHSHVFGEGGGESIAKANETNLLGQLPLNTSIRLDADKGYSPILENSAGEIAQLYRKIARNVASQVFRKLDARSPETADISYQ